MDPLTIIGLVGNIVQLVDFSGKLISKSAELYQSSEGALAEHVDIETVTNHLVLSNNKLKNSATTTGDSALECLCKSCSTAADELLAALDSIKVKGKQNKWKSIRKALRSVWSKEEIKELERRLARFREELNLRVTVDLREQVSQFKLEQSERLNDLDLKTKKIVDAIIKQEDVFLAAHDAQLSLMRSLHGNTVTSIIDQHNITRHEIRQQRDIIDQERCLAKLPIAAQAAFNSYDKRHDPLCLPNTRVDILKYIIAWADGQDERCIFWLNGLAGTGKSTIARTVAREYYEQDRLGASFFFSRGGGDTSHASKFFTSIAVQLAHKLPSLKRHVCEAIADRGDIGGQSLRDQWHQLVLRPLSNLDSSSSQFFVLVVDALDECDGENDIQLIVQLLAEARSLRNVRLRVFMTSRPEVPIRHGFCQIPDAEHQDFVLHNISPAIIDHDISIFLEYNLRTIGQERDLAAGWPGEQVIRRLVQSASGLFIWAATACRFIREGRKFATKRLSIILQGGSSVTAPEKHLDEIYITVLRNCVYQDYDEQEKEDLYDMLRKVLGSIVVIFSPLSADSLTKLLHVSKGDIDQTLEDLYAILDVPKQRSSPIRLHHPSFRDFLLNKVRCSDPHFWVNEKQAHRALADACIRLMCTTLKRDICGLYHPGALLNSVESSRVEQYLPPAVQYACLYWVQHLQRSGARLYDQVHRFLQEHLLHLLEAISWMRKTSEGILALNSLESIILADESPSLHTFIHDAKRFSLYNRSVIEQAPLQLYCSALVFAPEFSLVRNQFKDQMPSWITRLPKVQKEWSSALQTLEGHSGSVGAVAFSPDGKLIASASDDKTVRLWDPATGAALQTLEGHFGSVRAVTFSPDGKLVISASDHGTVRLWDLATGAVLRTLEGHLGWFRAVAFSPDGKLVASASSDKTIRLWDSATGEALQTLEGHLGLVRAVAFSLNGKLVASASYDKTVRLWDPATGAALQTLEGHLHWVRAIAFSPDGKLVASASGDKTVRLWDPATGAALQTLGGHPGWVSAIAFSPDGKLVALGSHDKTVRLWDPATGAVLQTLEGHLGWVSAVAFSPDGKLVASASSDKTVRLWDLATGAVLQTLKVNAVFQKLSFSSKGLYLETDWGQLDISSFSNNASLQLNSVGKLFIGESWVTYKMENVLWLPSEYRATCSAFQDNILILGHASGRLTFFEFNLPSIP